MADDVTKLTVVMSRAGLLLGTMADNKLQKPRVMNTFEKKMVDPKTAQEVVVPQIHMAPLPGIPPFYRVGANEGSYRLPNTKNNKEIYDLYARVTSPMVDPGEE